MVWYHTAVIDNDTTEGCERASRRDFILQMTRFPPDINDNKETEGVPAPRWNEVPATHCQKPAATVLDLGREGEC